MTAVEIERGGLEDVPAVVGHWCSLAAEQRDYGSHVLPEETEAAIREEIGRDAAAGRLLVAREGEGEIVGFVTFEIERGRYRKDATRGVVKAIYVVPERRGEGIGTALLDAAESTLAKRGATVVTLEAMAGNDAARRFYRERGYEPHRVAYEKPAESDNHSKEDG